MRKQRRESHLPGAHTVVKTTSLQPGQLLAAIGVAFVATAWWEVVKLFKGRA
ncbi:MAG TPA: hypothetical protein VHY08_26890 [Bacillota bacterium]|nr:hypothetical protein [Bacillota bacterium]